MDKGARCFVMIDISYFNIKITTPTTETEITTPIATNARNLSPEEAQVLHEPLSQNKFDPVYVDESWLKIWFTTAPSRLRTQSPETLDAKCFVASLFLSDAEAMSFRKRVQTFLGSSSNFEHCS